MLKLTLYFILAWLNVFYINNLAAQKNDSINSNPLKSKQMKTYTDKDIIIKLQKTPGMPNSIYYNLEIYGDGNYTFKGSLKRPNDYIIARDTISKNTTTKTSTISKDKTILTILEIETILAKAKEIKWEDTILRKIPKKAIIASCDRQLNIFSIWKNGSLKKIGKSFGKYKDKDTEALAEYILSLVENRLLKQN